MTDGLMRLLRELVSLDQRYRTDNRSGVLWLEVHYQHGIPRKGKLRETLLAPVVLEISLTS